MNYKKLYNQIIEKRKQNPITEGYKERHHILPKSLGGFDDKENLVDLTAREHFICHYLLAKMYPKGSNEWYKTNHAFMMMKCSSNTHKRYFNSRLYESLKENFSKVMSKAQGRKNNSQYKTMWIHNLDTLEVKKIKKDEIIPDGWVKGRIIDKKRYKLNKLKKKINRIIRKVNKLRYQKNIIKEFENFLESEYDTILHYSHNILGCSDVATIYRWREHLPFYKEMFIQGKKPNKEELKQKYHNL